nr:PQQ-dependent sugar dehydrogenase [Tomitella biformata]
MLLGGCASTPPAPNQPAASSPTAASAAESAGAPTLVGEPQVVASGLKSPWSIAFTTDGTALVSERDSGRILEVLRDGGTREVGLVDGVRHGGEGGLLGLAIDSADRLYVYSTGATGNRIERFALAGGPGAYGMGAPETIIEALPSAAVHNGGRIAFGPDGMLYAGVGDASDRDTAQDLASLGGKILRMTPDGDVPQDNPIPESLVYSAGHRNVQGLAWAEDGTMFASEFGQNTWDELNIITPGGNYGWPVVEGMGVEGMGVEGTGGAGSGFVDPILQWSPSEASPSGVAIADGAVFLANLRGQVLRVVAVSDPGAVTDYYAGELGRIRDVVRAPDGALWLLTNNTDGRGQPTGGDDKILAVTLG